MKKESVVERLKQFVEDEGRSCSMDIGGITPEYVQRMWGGSVPLADIKAAMEVLNSIIDSLNLH